MGNAGGRGECYNYISIKNTIKFKSKTSDHGKYVKMLCGFGSRTGIQKKREVKFLVYLE